jgi:uncharacterized membrane protein
VEPQYKIKDGKKTAKWKAGAVAGGVGGAFVTVLTFVIATLFPQWPESIQGAVVVVIVALGGWLATWIPAMVATYMKRPDPEDVPVVDKTTLPRRPVEPTPGIPDRD